MTPPYEPASLANAFLAHSFKKGDGNAISPMMIQKLLYLAHGYHLCIVDEPLISEGFEAWKFGPVVRSIYLECRRYVSTSINEYLTEWDDDWNCDFPVPPENDRSLEIIDGVWDLYKDYEPTRLSMWAHAIGGPWDKITKSGTLRRKRPIPDEIIRDYFDSVLNDTASGESK